MPERSAHEPAIPRQTLPESPPPLTGKANSKSVAMAGAFGGGAVALGAFGSHGLRSIVSEEMLAIWRTAVEYQMTHALAMLLLALASTERDEFRWPLRLWTAGICLFSGSLYALVLTQTRLLGAITPVGGILLVLGWCQLVWSAWQRHRAVD